MKFVQKLTATAAALALTFTAVPMAASAGGKGDFDQNNKVDTNDVRRLMTTLAKGEETSMTQQLWTDFDCDSKLSTSDARLLLSAVMVDSLTPVTNYAKPTGQDWWGENSISVLGDSISFGVGTSNDGTNSNVTQLTGGIPERSYVSFVKKAVQKANSGKMNYGFTSAYPTAWPGVARSEEIHAWPDRTEESGSVDWVCDNNDDGNRLTSIGMTSVIPWSTITYRLRKDYYSKYSYFCVYYDAVDNGASFCIANGSGGEVADVNGSKAYVSTKSDVRITKRTAFYKLSDCPKDSNGIPKIIICHDGTTNPVTITGIGYYKTLPKANNGDGYVTFNSFTRGGISLINLSDTVLDQATSADTFIMGLGFNDFNFNHVRVNNGEFKAKIDTLIRLCNEKGTNVIVNDYAIRNPELYSGWTDSQKTANAIVKSELRRFAKETGGVYIDQEAIWGDALYDSVNDKNEIGASSSMTKGDQIHPNHAGHKMMAKAVVAALGLEFTESWS
ncbi:MAG: hypothetical protein IJB27_05215 [Clostridia bacterium]|nr:hypothetical protein [Clostridia bacterium]